MGARVASALARKGGRCVVVGRQDFADQVRGRVGDELAHRDQQRRFVGLDRFAPAFGQKQGAQAVAHLVLDAELKHVQPDAVDVTKCKRLQYF
jgi:hypothetical protein